MTIMPGAGACWFEGNEAGCLILPGFTGTPQNVRPLAGYPARRGLAVAVPRIAGHGTAVQDLDATGPGDWPGTAGQALADPRSRCATVFAAGISLGGTCTRQLARRHQNLAGVVVMAAPVLDLEALNPVVEDPGRPAAIPAPWATVGVLVNDPGAGGITYQEMPLNALERGIGLIKQVRDGLSQVTAPALLIYGDSDQIIDKANGPFVLDQIASAGKPLLPLPDSAHELTLDVDRERLMAEIYDFIRARS
jgi:carboxylesterase